MCPESYGGPWTRVGWRRELGARDHMGLLPVSALRLHRDVEAKIQTQICLLCIRRESWKEEREGRQQAGAPYLHTLSDGVRGLCLGPSPFPKPRDP